MRGAAMSLTAAASGFVVLLTVSVVQSQNDWGVTYTSTKICAAKGSTVNITCSYRYPASINKTKTSVQNRYWFSQKNSYKTPVNLKTVSDYTSRVEYSSDENNCTLRIRDLRESDSAEYKFRFITNQQGGSFTGSPGVTLTVTDLQVKVRRSSTQTELQCHSSRDVADPPSYVWYQNGQKMEEETSSLRVSVRDDDSSYSCAVKGCEDYRSAPVYTPKLPSVSVSPSAETVEDSSVTLTCSSDANPAATHTWYKKNDRTRLSEGTQFVLSSIQSSDSGEYYCTAQNELGRRTSESISIDVKYAPKFPSVSVRPSGEIKEGSLVTLTCSSDANPAATHTWYKKNNRTRLSEEQLLVFSSIQSSDSGLYYCTAQNQLGTRESRLISTDVKYGPRYPSVSVSPTGEIKEGTNVTLTCWSDANPAATYSWYKMHGSKPLSRKPQFFLSSIQPSDSGKYHCSAWNKLGTSTLTPISIDVKYAPKLSSVSVSPTGEIKEGTKVTLTCNSDANPAATYTWYKGKSHKQLSEEPHVVFSSIQPSDLGEYYCSARNKLGTSTLTSIYIDVKYAPKLPSVSVSPSAEIVEGSSVTLTCSSDANPAADYTWYKEDEDSPKTSGQNFTITDTGHQHSGKYYCIAQNSRGQHNTTLQLTVVAEAWKFTAAATVPAVLLALILIAVILWITKNRTSKTHQQQPESAERPHTSEQCLQLQPAEDDVHYATVHFIKHKADSVYSNIRHTEEKEEKEETVEYATVKFKNASTAPIIETTSQEAAEDPAALYSTVKKFPRRGEINQ